MAETVGQTFANHQQRARGWLFTGLLAVIGFAIAGWIAILNPRNLVGLAFLALAGSVLGVVILLRGYATRLQDRIIRLEMQVRCARLGLAPDVERLSVRQLIAVRFASDAELPELMRRASAEKLDPVQIKRLIKEWQGDYLRI